VGRAHDTGTTSSVLGASASIMGSELPPPLPRYGAPALRSAPPRFPKLSPLCGCVRVHQHIIPDDMSIPSSAPLAYRGGAMRPFTPS
jgi:hypothetical protein